MRRLVLSSFALVLAVASSARAQVKLDPKFNEGSRVVRSSHQIRQSLRIAGMPVDTATELTSVTRLITGKPAADGTVRVVFQPEAQTGKISLPGDMKIQFDSANPDAKAENPMLEPFLGIFRVLSKATFTYVYGPDGKVRAVEGADKLLQTVPADVLPLMKHELDPAVLQREEAQERGKLPDGPVKVGDRWSRNEIMALGAGQQLALEVFYDYQGEVEKDGRKLDKIGIYVSSVKYSVAEDAAIPFKVANSDLKSAASTGTLLFDREKGEVVEDASSLRITGTLSVAINGIELPGELDLTIERKVAVEK